MIEFDAMPVNVAYSDDKSEYNAVGWFLVFVLNFGFALGDLT